jgi:hypothetical protein
VVAATWCQGDQHGVAVWPRGTLLASIRRYGWLTGWLLCPRCTVWLALPQYLVGFYAVGARLNHSGMICRLDVRAHVVFTSAVLPVHVESSPTVASVPSASLRTYKSRR